jgi:hypothetical protein
VVFEALNAELTDKHRQFLDQLAAKLSEKPDTRLILCGKVTRLDIMAMRQRDFTAPPEQGLTAPVPGQKAAGADLDSTTADTVLSGPQPGPPSIEETPLTDDEKERLIDLAKQRALAVKDYLIEAGGLKPDRLFVCYSDVEKEAGGEPPRVDLSI